jgi:SAM-dependent methyltransferase
VTTLREPRSPASERLTPVFSYSGSELEAMTHGRNYYRSILERFRPWTGSKVVEVGAGIGTFSSHLLSLEEIEELIAVEPGIDNFPRLRQRLGGDARAETVHAYIEQIPSLDSDSVVAVNVLEHVEDDAGFLRNAWRITRDGGHLLLYVPALPRLFGTLDVALGHHRRYTKDSLTRVIESAGWQVHRMSYMNLPGVLAWFLFARILKKTSVSDMEVGIYDRLVIPLTSRVEKFWSPPAGQNLIAIATKSSN